MKIMIASDLHGSTYYTQQLFDLFDKEQCDQLFLLGDLLYHGARNALPMGYDTIEMAELLNMYTKKITAVHGNCDSEVDQMVLQFDIQEPYRRMTVDGREWILTHGQYYNPEKLPPHKDGCVFFSGHTHIKVMEQKTDEFGMNVTVINPGSVSIPKDDSKHSCVIYENGTFSMVELDGTVIRTLTL